MTKSDKLCENAIKLCTGIYGYTTYENSYPYNVGVWDGAENCWSFDCLGMVHCLVNGFKNDHTVRGGGAVMDDFVLCTPEDSTLYDHCTDISSDFENIEAGELLYMDGHVGIYVGTVNIDRGGYTDVYNVAECSPSFGGGCQLTYVSSDGTRFNKKGGMSRGTWEKHGKFKAIDYVAEEPAEKVISDMDVNEYAEFIIGIVSGILSGKYGYNPQRKNTITVEYGENVYKNAQHIVNELYDLEQ